MIENVSLIRASSEHKPVIRNLMQFYIYDFSGFVDLDVNGDGLFPPYKGLNEYWSDKDRFPYIIQKGNTYIGFALVRWVASEQKKYYSMAEFFILKKYRREGIGRSIAMQLFDLYPGNWEVFQRESNLPAQLFWQDVINAYTKGDFTERFEDGKRTQFFEVRR